MPIDPGSRRFIYPILSLLTVMPIVVWFYWPAAHGLDVTGHQIGRDFINVWSGPQLAFGGRLQTLFDLKGYHAAIGELFGQPLPFHNWGYPLFTLLAFWPLAQLPYFLALAIWTIGLFAIFAGVTLGEVEREKRSFALLALMLAPACLINAVGGQMGFLSAALLLGGILLLDRRPILAGVLFGLLTFKPQIGLVLPFVLLALRAWRVIAAATVTAIVLVAVTIPVFGVDAWRHYLEVAGGRQVLLLERFRDFYTIMMASVFAAARTFGLSYTTAMAIQIAVAVPVIGSACWAVRRTADPCRRAFVLACAAPLITPYTFNYDLTALSAALVWTLAGRLPFRAEFGPVYLLAWIAPSAMMFFNVFGLGIMPLALLALYGVSLYEIAAEATSAGSTKDASRSVVADDPAPFAGVAQPR